MIEKLSFANYGNFKKNEWQTIDFTKQSQRQERTVFINNGKILNNVCLVGKNGSGKTSILNILGFLKFLITESHMCNFVNYCDEYYFIDEKKYNEFLIIFRHKEKRYKYAISLYNNKIIFESLKVYNSQKPTEIFKRFNSSEYLFNSKYTSRLDIIVRYCNSHTSFLSLCCNHNVKEFFPVFNFFDEICFNSEIEHEKIQKIGNENIKERLIYFLNMSDFDVKDIVWIYGECIICYENLNIKFKDESSGFKKIFRFLYYTLTHSNYSVIVYDNIEESLHTQLVLFMIFYIASKNDKQMIFSTHRIDILNRLRCDQINIIDNGEIINCNDYVKGNKNISNNYGDYYYEGVLGGVPNVMNKVN